MKWCQRAWRSCWKNMLQPKQKEKLLMSTLLLIIIYEVYNKEQLRHEQKCSIPNLKVPNTSQVSHFIHLNQIGSESYWIEVRQQWSDPTVQQKDPNLTQEPRIQLWTIQGKSTPTDPYLKRLLQRLPNQRGIHGVSRGTNLQRILVKNRPL